MMNALRQNRRLTVLSDLYLDRVLYGSLLIAALYAASFVNTL